MTTARQYSPCHWGFDCPIRAKRSSVVEAKDTDCAPCVVRRVEDDHAAALRLAVLHLDGGVLHISCSETGNTCSATWDSLPPRFSSLRRCRHPLSTLSPTRLRVGAREGVNSVVHCGDSAEVNRHSLVKSRGARSTASSSVTPTESVPKIVNREKTSNSPTRWKESLRFCHEKANGS